jgi:hypothetical protein
MYNKKEIYGEALKQDQVLQPSTKVQTNYSPEEIHTFFKTRGTQQWNKHIKSSIR